MYVESLRGPVGLFAVTLLSVVLAACSMGTGMQNTRNNQPGSSASGCGCGFLYATTTGNQILGFKLDSSGAPGAPVAVSGPTDSPGIASGTFNSGGSLSTAIELLYLSDPASNAVDVFSIDSNTGALTPFAGSPVVAPGSPNGVAITGYSMALTFLYTADASGTIDAFSATNGSLAPIAGSPYSAGHAPSQLAAFSSAQSLTSFIYAPDFADPNGGIYAFLIGLDGTLSAVSGSPFPTGASSGPASIATFNSGPGSGSVFVALSNTDQVAGFAASGSGTLTPFPGSPYPAGHGPSSVATASGPGVGFIYALNSGDHTISGYSFDFNTGIATPISGSPFPAGTASSGLVSYAPNGAAMTPNVLYVADQPANSIRVFSINPATGQLTPLPGSPFPAGGGPVALTAVTLPGPPPTMDPP